jgi:DNA-binding SARP family transcriptional activator
MHDVIDRPYPAAARSECDGAEPYQLVACCLGSFAVWACGSPVCCWGGHKSKLLLKRLLVAHPRPVRAERLMVELWPGDSESLRPQDREQLLRQRLHAAVSELRRALNSAHHDAGGWIVAHDGMYRVAPQARVWLDTLAFDRHWSSGQQRLRCGERAAAEHAFIRAAALYTGELLEDDGAEWIFDHRRYYERAHRDLLAALSELAFAGEDYPRALAWGQRLLQRDACREDIQRLVMRCFSRLEQRTQALRQYQECSAALHREFDTSPEAETRALFDRLRQGHAE